MSIKIEVRNGFSDRNDIKPISREIQYEALNTRTRVSLANLTEELLDTILNITGNGRFFSDDSACSDFMYKLLTEVFIETHRIDETYSVSLQFEKIKTVILENSYDDVFTIIEWIGKYLQDVIIEVYDYGSYRDVVYSYLRNKGINEDYIFEKYNLLFEKECVGYRLLRNGKITEITDERELSAVNEAILDSKAQIAEHFDKAVSLMTDRNKPDYANSIKESISAVEAACNSIIGEKGTLGEALTKIKKTDRPIHGALIEGYKKLYGYASDSKGIRHSGDMDSAEATFAEAKYMLVSCSAFVNYLREVANEEARE